MKVDSMKLSKALGLEHSRYVPVNIGGAVHNELAVMAYNIKDEEQAPQKDPFSHSSVGFGSAPGSSGRSSSRRSISGFHACHALPSAPMVYLHPDTLVERLNQYFRDQDLPNNATVMTNTNGLRPHNIAVCLEEVNHASMVDDLSRRVTVNGIIAKEPAKPLLDYAQEKGIVVIGVGGY